MKMEQREWSETSAYKNSDAGELPRAQNILYYIILYITLHYINYIILYLCTDIVVYWRYTIHYTIHYCTTGWPVSKSKSRLLLVIFWHSAQNLFLSYLSRAATVLYLYLYLYLLCRKGTKLKFPQGAENVWAENRKELEGWKRPRFWEASWFVLGDLLGAASIHWRHELEIVKWNYTHTCEYNIKIVKKVKCTIVQALRLCTGRTAHRGCRDIALLYRHWGSVQDVRPIGGVEV